MSDDLFDAGGAANASVRMNFMLFTLLLSRNIITAKEVRLFFDEAVFSFEKEAAGQEKSFAAGARDHLEMMLGALEDSSPEMQADRTAP